VLFDFDETHREDLPELAPNVRWIQATASNIGKFVAEMHYAERMPNTVVTNTKGVHGQPLAEFSLMAMLMFRKGVLHNLRNQARRHWERYGGTDLEGRTAVVVGLGEIGSEVARVCRSVRMQVIGVGRSKNPDPERMANVDEYVAASELRSVLPRAEHLILVLPHTPETEDLFGAEEFGLLPEGAVLVNIGRGQVVDEGALLDALRSGHLAGAGLDVFKEEPLPRESPFWDLPNVYVSPHSGSTTPQENRRITDFFCENLRRYLDDKPLVNVLAPGAYY
jgi:phosphoglycerate dehydrogenase-like enzyme